jgi:hypothetical protein
MKRQGVLYDTGRVLYMRWRPVFDPDAVRRDLRVIRDELHCTAVRVCGRDVDRLTFAAQEALRLGLEVWFSPELWDRSWRAVVRYLGPAAARAEQLRRRWNWWSRCLPGSGHPVGSSALGGCPVGSATQGAGLVAGAADLVVPRR